MSDDLTRAIAEALGCFPSKYGDRCDQHTTETAVYAWPCAEPVRVAAALAPMIEERVREAQYVAWSAGYGTGYRDCGTHQRNPRRPNARNPYRTGADQ